MSDDEDEGQLQIDESPTPSVGPEASESSSSTSSIVAEAPVTDSGASGAPEVSEAPGAPGALGAVVEEQMPEEKLEKIPENPEKEEKPEEKPENPKEDGEIDDEEEEEKEEPMEIDEKPVVPEKSPSKAKKPAADPEDSAPTTSKSGNSRKKSAEMGPPLSTERTPHRKRKESVESHSEKRKSGLETVAATSSSSEGPSTPQRSKRASSQYASAAITSLYVDESQMNSITSIEGSSNPKRQKLSNAGANVTASPIKEGNGVSTRDASNSVITTRKLDTAGLISNESVLSAEPGSTILLELTVMYKTKSAIMFQVNGCDLFGYINDGLPPMAAAAKEAQANNNNKNKKEEGKEGSRRSGSSASNNGRSTRGGSVVENTKNDKNRKDGKKKIKDEAADNDEHDEEQEDKFELLEQDDNEMHECREENCFKKYRRAEELEYHKTKYHRKKLKTHDTIATNTNPVRISEIDDEEVINQAQPMPVLSKEVPIKAPHCYEDLSDDDDEPEVLKVSAPSVAGPASAALFGLAQGTPQRSEPAVVPTKITNLGMTPVSVEKKRVVPQHTPQQQKAPIASSPAGPSHLLMATPPTSMHPLAAPVGPQHFLPQFSHPQMMIPQNYLSVMHQQHQQALQHQQQQQQQQRTPSRQLPDGHKIHELSKAKENEQKQRGTPQKPGPSAVATSTPQRPPQFMGPPQMMQAVTPQQQQAAAVALATQMFAHPNQNPQQAMMMLRNAQAQAAQMEQLHQMAAMFQSGALPPGFQLQPPK